MTTRFVSSLVLITDNLNHVKTLARRLASFVPTTAPLPMILMPVLPRSRFLALGWLLALQPLNDHFIISCFECVMYVLVKDMSKTIYR